MKKLIKISLALLAILLSACERDIPTTLPPATQEGKNTFGCYINGELFLKNNQPTMISWLQACYVSIDNSIFPKGIEIQCEGRNRNTIRMFFKETVVGSNIVINEVSYAGIKN